MLVVRFVRCPDSSELGISLANSVAGSLERGIRNGAYGPLRHPRGDVPTQCRASARGIAKKFFMGMASVKLTA